MKKYIKIWKIMAIQSFQIAFLSRFGAIVFIVGKLLRFLFFMLFLFILQSKTRSMGQYSMWQVMFFFGTFNLIDTLSQLFLREVYRFRSYVVSGDFDYILLRPISPLFRSLFGGSDPLDISMLVISCILLIYTGAHLEAVSLLSIVLFILLVVNGFVIAVAFHIFILAIGILTTEVDNTIWLYRDLTQMGRVPIDLYNQSIRGILTFIIPVGVMMTFPAKAYMGLLSLSGVAIAFICGISLLVISYRFWNYSIKQYASASS